MYTNAESNRPESAFPEDEPAKAFDASMPAFDQNQQYKLAQRLKLEAARLGFDACGIAKAQQLDEQAKHLETWLANGQYILCAESINI